MAAKPSTSPVLGPPPNSIFALIHELSSSITGAIDTSLTCEQLHSPPINYTLVRPIVERFALKFQDEKGPSSGSGLLTVPRSGDGGESGAAKIPDQVGRTTTPRWGAVRSDGQSVCASLDYVAVIFRNLWLTQGEQDTFHQSRDGRHELCASPDKPSSFLRVASQSVVSLPLRSPL